MKTALLSITAIMLATYSYAQNNFPPTGNVSIGTTNPQNTLEVGGSGARFTGAFTETTDFSGLYAGISGTPRIGFFNGIAAQNWQIDNASGVIRFFQPGVTYMELSTAGLMLVNPTTGIIKANGTANSYFMGNLGVGTANPDAKLTVNGTIHTKEVKVDANGWPDYVFNPTYNLPDLRTVRLYIDKNHHLPDMPSAKDIDEHGVNLGEMVKVQTKKIEELTLYLLEQQQKYEQQNARIAKLEKELAKVSGKNKR